MDALNNPVLRSTGPLQVTITDPSVCYYCKTSPLDAAVTYCPSCGFPQRGAEDEQKKFITDKRVMLIKLEGMHDQVKKARNMLFLAAGIYALSYLLGALLIAPSAILFIEGAIVCGAFVGFGIWANKNPYPAVLTGLIVYVTLIILYAAIVGLFTIVSGILFKIIILSGLIYGLKAAKDAKQFEEELKAQKIDLSAGQ